jgi:hypothetical protein
MKKLIYLVCIFVFILADTIHADWKDTMNKSWEKAKDSTFDYYQSYFPGQKMSLCSKKQPPILLNDKWDNILTQLEIATNKFQQIRQAPDNSWFGEDKKSLAIEFNALLDKTIVLLLADTRSMNCWDKQQQFQRAKIDMQQQITQIHESLIAASGEQQIELEKKLLELTEKISKMSTQQKNIKNEMRLSLQQLGLQLTSEQLTMLFSRVDAKDILQMVTVFDAIKSIIQQLEKLMQTTSDNLIASKKYYAMYVVLSEMIVYIQNNYLSLINNDYIPGIEAIITKVKKIQKQTINLKNSSDSNRQKVYKHNLSAQKLTTKTALLYLEHMQLQQKKIVKASQIAHKDLLLAKNTYETVQLSIELLTLLKSSRNAFQQMSQLQLPEIVPLKNIAMKKEYQRLTRELSN